MSYCYICLEEDQDDLLHNVCSCKHNCVHTKCLLKCIEKSKKISCTICNEPLKGIKKSKKYNSRYVKLIKITLINLVRLYYIFVFYVTLKQLISVFHNISFYLGVLLITSYELFFVIHIYLTSYSIIKINEKFQTRSYTDTTELEEITLRV